MRVDKKETKTEIIEITEDVRVPGTDVILEAGDKVEVLKESMWSVELVDAIIALRDSKGDSYVVDAIINTAGRKHRDASDFIDKLTYIMEQAARQ